jgi:hypothetical protein
MFRLFVAALLISGWSMAALSLHVVQTAGGFRVVTKNELGLEDTFVDARNWSRSDEDTHHTLYQRLRQLDKTSMLDRDSHDEVALDSHVDSVKQAWERLQREAAARRRP